MGGKGTMFKAITLIVILFAGAAMLLPARAQLPPLPGWQITVNTNKPYYHIGDAVYISGKLTRNYQDITQRRIALGVKRTTSSSSYYVATVYTDNNAEYSASFTLGSDAALGEWTVTATADTDTPAISTNQTTFLVTDAIYIKASGEVEPADAPIDRSGNTYTLKNNVIGKSVGGIVIEKDGIILDGAGHTLSGMNVPSSNGISLAAVSNTVIENITVRWFFNGINETTCSNDTIIDTSLPSNSYGIHLRGSDYNIIEGNSISTNNYAGIFLEASHYNNISKNRLANTITSNHIGGIRLEYSSDNDIVDNNLTQNTWYGVYLSSSYSNHIFHNNFVYNTIQAYVDSYSPGNVWDDSYPSGGNYWTDYAGADANHDGIGDTPYNMAYNNKDNYPLMNPWNPTETTVTETNGTEHTITISTNATITQMVPTPDALNFTATGAPGSKAYLLIIIPQGLNSTNLKVSINGTELTNPQPTITKNSTHYFVYCELTFESTYQIIIPFSVPIIPLGTLAATATMISMLGVYIKLRKRKHVA